MSKGTRAVASMLKRERAIAGLGILLASSVVEIAPAVTTVVVSPRVDVAVRLSLKGKYLEDAALAGFEVWGDDRVNANEIRLLDPTGRVLGVLILRR